MNDSFRRAQARYDAMEPPDNDGAEISERIAEELERQIREDAERCTNLLCEKLTIEAGLLLAGKHAEFLADCGRLLDAAIKAEVDKLVDYVSDALFGPGRDPDDSLEDVVAQVLRRF